jgi:Ca2+-binding RTX toxin-like protein
VTFAALHKTDLKTCDFVQMEIGRMTIKNGTSGPDTLSGSGNDTIFGFAGDDSIYGNANNNRLVGGSGNDYIKGRLDSDIHFTVIGSTDYADYSDDAAEGGSAGVLVNLNHESYEETGNGLRYFYGTAQDGFGNTDKLVYIANVVGTQFDDQIVGQDHENAYGLHDGGVFGPYYPTVDNHLFGMGGNDFLSGLGGNDELYGGTGSDTLDGGTGADYLDGGAGFDYVTYSSSQSGLFASLAAPVSNTGDAAGDTYVLIEALVGSYGDDVLVTSRAGGNQLWGSSGNDQLYALGGHNYINGGNGNDSIYSNGGSNTIDGDAGFDIVRYDYATSRVVAALDHSASPYNTGAAAGDNYTSVEGLTGSDFNDVLFGDAGGNQLYGRAGSDFLIGNDGDDALYGGTGANELWGGGGNDYFDFYGAELQAGSYNRIDDFSSTAGNTDHLYFFGVSSNDVTFVPDMFGTAINIAVSGGTATIFANGANINNVINQTSFF